MKRSIVVLLLGSLFLSFAGCNDPEQAKRIADLEERVAALEKKPAPAGAPGAPAAPAANAEEEQAAATLLKEVSQLMEKPDYDGAKAKLAELKEKYSSTRAAKAAMRLEEELSVIGRDEAPLQVEKWYQGSEKDVHKGKATLYVFWEVWCPHCRREVPKLTETYNKYNGQGLDIVGLTKQTRDIKDEDVVKFIEENKVVYPIAKEQGDAMSTAYGVRGIPAAAVVKGGKVVWRGHPAKLTDAMIQGWL